MHVYPCMSTVLCMAHSPTTQKFNTIKACLLARDTATIIAKANGPSFRATVDGAEFNKPLMQLIKEGERCPSLNRGLWGFFGA